jgi:hypothetical protein
MNPIGTATYTETPEERRQRDIRNLGHEIFSLERRLAKARDERAKLLGN